MAEEAPSKSGFWRKLLQLFLNALFVASIVHILSPMLAPVKQAGLAASSHIATLISTHWRLTSHSRDELLIVKIDNKRFSEKYEGTSPLPRCPLHEDLEKLVNASHLKTIAVDLDLSPTPACLTSSLKAMGVLPASTADPENSKRKECDCQLKVDKLLEHNHKRLVLITPLSAPAVAARAELDVEGICKWADHLRNKDVRFAHPVLKSSFGLLESFDTKDNTGRHAFGVAIADHMAKNLNNPGPAISIAEPSDSGPNVSICDSKNSRGKAADPITRPVIAGALFNAQDAPLNWSPADLQCASGVGSCRIRAAIFGAGYDLDDRFMTVIGQLNGIDVHAAIALAPHGRQWILVDLLLDTLIGIGFGLVCHRVWKHYFHLATSTVKWKRDNAWGFLLLSLALAATILLLFILPLSALIQSQRGIVINPAAMALGMAADAAIFSGIHTAHDLLHPPSQSHIATGDGRLTAITRLKYLISTHWSNTPWLLFYVAVVLRALHVI